MERSMSPERTKSLSEDDTTKPIKFSGNRPRSADNGLYSRE